MSNSNSLKWKLMGAYFLFVGLVFIIFGSAHYFRERQAVQVFYKGTMTYLGELNKVYKTGPMLPDKNASAFEPLYDEFVQDVNQYAKDYLQPVQAITLMTCLFAVIAGISYLLFAVRIFKGCELGLRLPFSAILLSILFGFLMMGSVLFHLRIMSRLLGQGEFLASFFMEDTGWKEMTLETFLTSPYFWGFTILWITLFYVIPIFIVFKMKKEGRICKVQTV